MKFKFKQTCVIKTPVAKTAAFIKILFLRVVGASGIALNIIVEKVIAKRISFLYYLILGCIVKISFTKKVKFIK